MQTEAPLSREEALARLRALKPELTARNVRSMALFGSVARGEARAASDLDLLVEFEETPDLFEFIRLRDWLSERLGVPVDLVTEPALHRRLRDRILAEAVYA